MNRKSDRFARYNTEPLYNTKAVVQRTGISADTLRAWERRYGVPHPQRTSGRHRAYSERDIAVISWLHEQIEQGLSISQAVAMLEIQHHAAESDAEPQVHPIAALQNECLNALLAFDTVQADVVLSKAFSLHPTEHVCMHLIHPMMVAIGNGWHSGTISIAQEHAATAFIRAKLSAMINQARTDAQRGTIVLTAAPQEQHDTGLMMLALFLLRRGWSVVFLGGNLPGEEVLSVVNRMHPDCVVVSATMYESRVLASVLLQALADLPQPPVIGYGGAAFNGNSNPEKYGVYLGKDILEACATIDTLLANKPHSS